MRVRNQSGQRGSALILTLLVGIGLISLTVLSVHMSMRQHVTLRAHAAVLQARQIAESGAAQALARRKEAGIAAPTSGVGGPSWVSFGSGEFIYDTSFDPLAANSMIRAWGRVRQGPTPSGSPVTPDHPDWDDTGYLVQGVEVQVMSERYIPDMPIYTGNGGIQQPEGGFAWDPGVDPADPLTWITVAAADASSSQSSTVPMVVSAQEHPIDFLTAGGAPDPVTSSPHPYPIWTSQNPIGQFNTQAWFNNSAAPGDATSNVFPAPTAANYVMDPNSSSSPYPVNSTLPDVQSFAWELWTNFKDDNTITTRLGSGSHSGAFGNLASPELVFVTGELGIPSGQTFSGTGVLVIRDDFDPNTDTDNRPGTFARLDVAGTLEWTGIVVIAGWTPDVIARAGSNTTVVGAFFGEDSVQSGSEISLDSATIGFDIQGDFRILFSRNLFIPGGPVHDLLPKVMRTVVGSRNL